MPGTYMIHPIHFEPPIKFFSSQVIAIGDSYNDISMLRKADIGILFNPPQNVIDENKDLRVVNNYDDLRKIISKITNQVH